MDPLYGTRLHHSFQGGPRAGPHSPTIPVRKETNGPVECGGDLLAEERSSGASRAHSIGGGFLFNPLLSTQEERSEYSLNGRNLYSMGDSST